MIYNIKKKSGPQLEWALNDINEVLDIWKGDPNANAGYISEKNAERDQILTELARRKQMRDIAMRARYVTTKWS